MIRLIGIYIECHGAKAAKTMQEHKLRCVTWNIHRAKGSDGKVDANRVMDVIASDLAPLRLDVLALQEADEDHRPHARILNVHRVAELTGLSYVHDSLNLRWGRESDGFLGSILFLNKALEKTHADVIDLPGHCHRGAVAVETLCDGRTLRIMTMHLSLWQPLRIVQMRVIGQYLRRRPRMQTLMLGDFNEWRPWGGWMFHKHVVGATFKGPVRRTFPSSKPLLPLDRVMTDAPGALNRVKVLDSASIKSASDHLPLTATVTISNKN
ncbi:MAG: endonuclease/exonuclease/phosphatase family protein [Pseudomonadota bacterium]